MSLEKYKAGLSEQYQGEVIGEVAINLLLSKFRGPREQYLLGTALQLETETKARLRPFVAALGIEIIESEESRQAGAGLGAALEGLDWRSSMKLLAEALIPYVDKYQEISDIAPPEYREIAELMVSHEKSIQQLWEQEALGDSTSALEEIRKQLLFPLPDPSN
jgi:hypothetical protein